MIIYITAAAALATEMAGLSLVTTRRRDLGLILLLACAGFSAVVSIGSYGQSLAMTIVYGLMSLMSLALVVVVSIFTPSPSGRR